MEDTAMRRGRVFRRCTGCGSTVGAKRCAKCGSDRATWAFQVDLSASGERRRQAKRSGFATKSAAVSAMAELQTAAAAGRPEPSRMTVGEWLDEWLPSIAGRSAAARSRTTS
jgi:Arm DNA-binding domain